MTALVVPLWGWTYAQGVFGLAISISSTVVLIRSLTDVGLLDSAHGRIAVGWVVVEDLATVVVLEMTGYALHRLGVSPQEIALIARGLRSR